MKKTHIWRRDVIVNRRLPNSAAMHAYRASVKLPGNMVIALKTLGHQMLVSNANTARDATIELVTFLKRRWCLLKQSIFTIRRKKHRERWIYTKLVSTLDEIISTQRQQLCETPSLKWRTAHGWTFGHCHKAIIVALSSPNLVLFFRARKCFANYSLAPEHNGDAECAVQIKICSLWCRPTVYGG